MWQSYSDISLLIETYCNKTEIDRKANRICDTMDSHFNLGLETLVMIHSWSSFYKWLNFTSLGTVSHDVLGTVLTSPIRSVLSGHVPYLTVDRLLTYCYIRWNISFFLFENLSFFETEKISVQLNTIHRVKFVSVHSPG